MVYFGILAALVTVGIAVYFWYKMRESIVPSDSPDSPFAKKSRGGPDNSLEEFVTAYRQGKVAVVGAAAPAPTVAAATAAPAVTVPIRRDHFLSGAAKLAFLICKAGLKDHHIFAHVQLATLSTTGVSEAALARASIDLLVCNAEMSPVAAIDVIGPDGRATDTLKVDYLRSLGIRYLRLSAKTLPKPEEIRALLYRM
ncbi:MAG TPA: DUF2726 domain-containing protein [Burkholderiales bacterium]|nr:DUF2726 domain-containing protein [Burkholderiales bacterium]